VVWGGEKKDVCRLLFPLFRKEGGEGGGGGGKRGPTQTSKEQ